MADELIGLAEIDAAADRLRGRILRSPLVPLVPGGVWLKAESLQASGSFKLRGALNSLLQLDEGAARRGVVAHSSGNHAIAVALAGATLGVAVTVVMPHDAPATKLARTRAFGASVELVDPDSESRQRRAVELAERSGLAMIEPYDSDDVLAATGTIALEILDDLAGEAPPVIYVPISGGGLAGGIATAAKLRRPGVRVVGVEPEVAADALESWRAGRAVVFPASQMARTMADGLRVQQVGERPWVHLRQHLDDIVTVSEDEIRASMRRIASDTCLIAEPSGAVAAAAALARRGLTDRSARPVAVLSGGNVDPAQLVSVLVPT